MPADQPQDVADWRPERSCPICWTTFAPSGPKHRYCSDRCRKAGHTRRHTTPASPGSEALSRPSRAPVAVRDCPHCGGEVSIVALITTPEAARPSSPEPEVIPLRRA